MKILILVPDGVGIRNYLYSDFLVELNKRDVDVYIAHKVSSSALKEIRNNKKTEIKDHHELPSFKESVFQKFLRETAAYSRLKRFKKQLNNPSILNFWFRRPKNKKERLFYRLVQAMGKLIHKSYGFIRFVEVSYDRQLTKSKAYQVSLDLLNSVQPDFVLNLHQRAPITAPIIEASKKLQIPTSTVVFSWDNVPKARLISRVNFYFVWSELMKNQLLELYPEIRKENVFISGSPQFEFYFKDKFKLSKKEFFQKWNLDIHKKTICFSGDDLTTSPYDQVYLEDLCKEVMKMKEEKRPQILFRRCPVDFSPRFDKVLEKYENLITPINPDWKVEKGVCKIVFNLIYPGYNDISLLVNTCLHSDVVINLGSTMAHDFAVYDKPCLYLNYDPVANSRKPVKLTYSYQHFKSMESLDAVGWINNSIEFRGKLELALYRKNEIGTDRKKWLQKIINHPLERSSEQLAKLIIKTCT